MRKIELIAHRLSDGQWHSSGELARIQHRFGASILILRKGEFDQLYWEIEKRQAGVGVWHYRFVKKSKTPYKPQSPRCPTCGTRMHVRDDRT